MPPVGFEPTISAGERPAAAHLLKSSNVQVRNKWSFTSAYPVSFRDVDRYSHIFWLSAVMIVLCVKQE